MRVRWGVAGLMLATFPCFSAPAATPFGLDDYYLLADVSEPAFSPSGDRIAYTVSRNDKKSDKSTSDIWSVPWSGGEPVQLTRTPKNSEWQPRYASDGKSLFFPMRCGKDETTQLWRMSAKGSGARKVTEIPGGISDFDLSPDGRRAVVVAEVGLDRRQQDRNTTADRNGTLPVQAGRRRLSRRSHAATVHRRPRHRQGAAADPRASAITGTPSGRPTARPSRTPRKSAARPTVTLTTRSSCRESMPAKPRRSARLPGRTTIRTGARVPPGRRIHAACSGWRVARTSGSTTRRRSSPWLTSRPAKSRDPRASIAGSTFRSSRRTARYVSLIEQDRDTWLARIGPRAATSNT